MQTGHVATEGDELYFEVRGDGPPLLMIHGGVMDASGFARAADLLAADYQVITYDRRAYSRSSRRDPQNFEIGQQARDAVAVLRANGHEAARIVGSSGGAIIGLELAKTRPEAVTAVVAHEPPVLRVLPDAAQLQVEYARIYLAAWTDGAQQAMRMFNALNPIERSEADMSALTPDDLERTRGNIEFFITQEMLPFAGYKPDVATILANGVRVVLGMGEMSREQSPGRTAPIVAEQLGCPLVVFPGHHVSYLGQAKAWVETVRRVIG